MLNFDRLKVKSPIFGVLDYNKEYFIESEKIFENGVKVVTEKYSVENAKVKYRGINLISIKTKYDGPSMERYCLIVVTGRILGKNYYNLINKHNIKEVIEAINRTKLITLAPEIIIHNSKLLSCDLTFNLRVDEIEPYFKAIATLSNANHKIARKEYLNLDQFETVTLMERVYKRKKRKKILCEENPKDNDMKKKWKKHRVSFYNKFIEMNINKEKYSFLSEKEICAFKNILRVEFNLRTFKNMRTAFDINEKELMLHEVLNSKSTKIVSVMRRMVGIQFYKKFYKVIPAKKPVDSYKEKKRKRQLIKSKNNFYRITRCLQIGKKDVHYHRKIYLKIYYRQNEQEIKKALYKYIDLQNMILSSIKNDEHTV